MVSSTSTGSKSTSGFGRDNAAVHTLTYTVAGAPCHQGVPLILTGGDFPGSEADAAAAHVHLAIVSLGSRETRAGGALEMRGWNGSSNAERGCASYEEGAEALHVWAF